MPKPEDVKAALSARRGNRPLDDVDLAAQEWLAEQDPEAAEEIAATIWGIGDVVSRGRRVGVVVSTGGEIAPCVAWLLGDQWHIQGTQLVGLDSGTLPEGVVIPTLLAR